MRERSIEIDTESVFTHPELSKMARHVRIIEENDKVPGENRISPTGISQIFVRFAKSTKTPLKTYCPIVMNYRNTAGTCSLPKGGIRKSTTELLSTQMYYKQIAKTIC